MRWLRILVLGGLGVTGLVPPTPASGQSDGEAVAGYDFYNLRALADGVTADFKLEDFLPVEHLVGLSSITSESHFSTTRSDALAALPDPGDVILTLPGTLATVSGISGIPDYPAAARADVGSTPVDDVQLFPDAGLGAGQLHAEASESGSSASAHVGNQVDTVGLLPAFSIGSIKTTARTDRVNATTYESTATTSVSDVRLLGGLVRISQVTSEVVAGIVNDQPFAEVTNLIVSGATVAGQAVGITNEGIVGLGSATALGPVVDALVQPLVDQGVRVTTLPATETVGDRMATATGGALQIEVPISVQGYPGVFQLTLGRATAELEVGALTDESPTNAADDGGSGDGFDSAPLDDSTFLPNLGDGSGLGSDLSLAPPQSTSKEGPTDQLPTGPGLTVPVGRVAADWDILALYRVLLLGGIALVAAGQIVVRTTLSSTRRPNDLRPLWRW